MTWFGAAASMWGRNFWWQSIEKELTAGSKYTGVKCVKKHSTKCRQLHLGLDTTGSSIANRYPANSEWTVRSNSSHPKAVSWNKVGGLHHKVAFSLLWIWRDSQAIKLLNLGKMNPTNSARKWCTRLLMAKVMNHCNNISINTVDSPSPKGFKWRLSMFWHKRL